MPTFDPCLNYPRRERYSLLLTSLARFYAPWCGHCQNLKPAYESAAKALSGIAKVTAVNCDDDANKAFCGTMGVQGFPTLKIVRPNFSSGGKKTGKGKRRPSVDDYRGQRSARQIVEAVKEQIPNIVKRVTEDNLDDWLATSNATAKAILFSEKGAVSAMLRALAIDFADVIPVAQVRSKERSVMQAFGVAKVPALVLLPGGTEKPVAYDGEMKKEGMVNFLAQAAEPNPEAPKPDKQSRSKSKEKTQPQQKPLQKEGAAISIHTDASPVRTTCLNPDSKTCILLLTPDPMSSVAEKAVASLSKIHRKHRSIPILGISPSNPLSADMIKHLHLGTDSHDGQDATYLIATNPKRKWFKRYPGSEFDVQNVESWVDTIRMGEGEKEQLDVNVFQDHSAVDDKIKPDQPIEGKGEGEDHNEL